MKYGYVYKNMIAPLELQLYKHILGCENKVRQRLDRTKPQLRNIEYDHPVLDDLAKLRKSVPAMAEVAIRISLWKDLSVLQDHIFIHGVLNKDVQLVFAHGFSIVFRQWCVIWKTLWKDTTVGLDVMGWDQVLEGSRTPESFFVWFQESVGETPLSQYNRLSWTSSDMVAMTERMDRMTVKEIVAMYNRTETNGGRYEVDPNNVGRIIFYSPASVSGGCILTEGI